MSMMTQAMIPYLCSMHSCYIGSFCRCKDVSMLCGTTVVQGSSRMPEPGTLSLDTQV
jgi:hypothetical protein